MLPRLRLLGLPGDELKAAQLKKAAGAFAHLEHLVVHNLLAADGEPISAVAKNPIGGNVLLESELEGTPLARVAAEIAAMPRLEALKPQLTDAELERVCTALMATRVRYPAAPLVRILTPFCKQTRTGTKLRQASTEGERFGHAAPAALARCASAMACASGHPPRSRSPSHR